MEANMGQFRKEYDQSVTEACEALSLKLAAICAPTARWWHDAALLSDAGEGVLLAPTEQTAERMSKLFDYRLWPPAEELRKKLTLALQTSSSPRHFLSRAGRWRDRAGPILGVHRLRVFDHGEPQRGDSPPHTRLAAFRRLSRALTRRPHGVPRPERRQGCRHGVCSRGGPSLRLRQRPDAGSLHGRRGWQLRRGRPTIGPCCPDRAREEDAIRQDAARGLGRNTCPAGGAMRQSRQGARERVPVRSGA